MYGWRAKIGLITPMCQSAEHAFHIYAPEGVSFASTKLDCEVSGWDRFADQLDKAAAQFKNRNVDAVALGCTSGCFMSDGAWEQKCISRIEQSSGVPSLTTSTAVLEGFQKLGTKKAAVLTPYDGPRNEAVKQFFSGHGVEVTNMVTMDMAQFKEAGLNFEDADEHFLYQHAIHMDLKGADTFFLDCMELATMEIISALETVLEIPVITCHQVTLWSALRHSGVGAKIPGLGKLFTL